LLSYHTFESLEDFNQLIALLELAPTETFMGSFSPIALRLRARVAVEQS